MTKNCPGRREPKLKSTNRICRMMRPNMHKQSHKGSDAAPPLVPSYYDIVMEETEAFLEIANSHTSGLKDFLRMDGGVFDYFLRSFYEGLSANWSKREDARNVNNNKGTAT
ncbi:hypothetical protein B0H14DRAFT_3169357 [Mycena olivaceomarginata]|nr:hypothetical protein B0H14DRAFT_3169357 [Mycena olivaceomarginata]